ncbi:hypothetical protein Scep_026344 [Stephania cephalantha]|uniref:Uncharacterized protein n=1 Tax=Stephania cephalantha TaxID=152367 RepID=A0AAP0HT85_9MAGN
MKSSRIGNQESDSQLLSSSNKEYNAIKTKSKSLSSTHSMNTKMLDEDNNNNNIESRCSSFSTDETKYIVFSFRKDGDFNISTNENSKTSNSSTVDRLRRINRKVIFFGSLI